MKTKLKELREELLKKIRELLNNKHNGHFMFPEDTRIHKYINNDLTDVVELFKASELRMAEDSLVIVYKLECFFEDYSDYDYDEISYMLRYESTDTLVNIYEELA